MPALNIGDFYIEIGSLIKTERLKNGMSQEVLGEGVGLTRASVINLEKGRHRPSVYQLIVIAELLHIPYTNLIPAEEAQLKTKKVVSKDISGALIDGEAEDKTSKIDNNVLDFLTSIKKQ